MAGKEYEEHNTVEVLDLETFKQGITATWRFLGWTWNFRMDPAVVNYSSNEVAFLGGSWGTLGKTPEVVMYNT